MLVREYVDITETVQFKKLREEKDLLPMLVCVLQNRYQIFLIYN